jgi:uncharacterized protein (TIGR01627 family)
LKPASSDAEILERAIPELVAANPDQLSECEYRYVADVVTGRAAGRGCNLLVFGVGRDSVVWLWLNRGGRTVFLESSAHWAARVRAQIPWIIIYPVRYGTRLSQWKELLAAAPGELRLALPTMVAETPWDVIFVDAPMGCDGRCPGRMQSIYTAAVLARRTGGVDVLVHDCDREAESAFCDRFLGGAPLVRALDRMRHYRTPSNTGVEREQTPLEDRR